MRRPESYLSDRLYEFFDVGSIDSMREMIQSNKKDAIDMGEFVRRASFDYGIDKPDEATISKINQNFKHTASGWDDDIREDIAKFACWSRQIAIALGNGSNQAFDLTCLVERIEAKLAGQEFAPHEADSFLDSMNRAGLALWAWFGALEENGIEYMGELVVLPREKAFSYLPEKYNDVETIMKTSIDIMLQQKGLGFNFWKAKDRPGFLSKPGLA